MIKEVSKMEKQLILKMIRKSMKPYEHEDTPFILTEKGWNELYEKVQQRQKDADSDLHEIIEDIVYEYVT
jgi:hypothetical protein